VSPLLGLVLAGCPYIGDDAAFERFDVDDDGHAWPDDCDEGDPSVFPGAEERCNGVDDDCDGTVDEDDAIDASAWYSDADGDGHGDVSDVQTSCDPGDGWSADGDDCDDDEATTSPSAEEVCDDGVDNDCVDDPAHCRLVGDVGAAEALGGRVLTPAAPASVRGLAAGDFNGDGFSDLAVGHSSAAQVQVFLGPFEGERSTPDWTLSGPSGSRFGHALVADDLDGDGLDDLVVTAPGWTRQLLGGPVPSAGAAFAFVDAAWRAADPVDLGPYVLVEGASSYEGLGHSLAVVRGPEPRVAVGTPSVGILLVSPAGEPVAGIGYDRELACPMNEALAALDLDGDGQEELAGSSDGCPALVGGAGLAHVYPGDLEGEHGAEAALLVVHGPHPQDAFGFNLADRSDLDGDGHDDLLVGAPSVTGDLGRTGAWFGFSGTGRGELTADLATWRRDGPGVDGIFGFSQLVEDLDGDGLADLFVAGPRSAGDGGLGRVWYGPVGSGAPNPELALTGAVGSYFGVAAVALPRANDDAIADLAVWEITPNAPTSTVHIVFGRGQ
jgi:hypothetical protein